MRVIYLVFAFTVTALSFASAGERLFTCNATDSMDRVSELDVNVDDGVMRFRIGGPTSDWRIAFSQNIGCGLRLQDNEVCQHSLVHNFDDPKRAYFKASGGVRCKDREGLPIADYDGDFEINSAGDGIGSFVCGRLPKFNLRLKNCRASLE